MSPSRLAVALLLALPSDALAAAGGGSGGYGGGGGGGGGGYSGGGGGSGGGSLSGFEVVLLIVGVIVFVIFSAITAAWARRKLRKRTERVTRAAAEAAEDDADFGAELVQREAANLFRTIQDLWTKRDRGGLSRLVGDDLAKEWVRRLDDFDRKGWHNVVRVDGGPEIQYVGLVNREDDSDDRVVVRVEATLTDYVETKNGRLMADGSTSTTRSLTEYWTLGKRGDRWILLSIEQEEEGKHQLGEEIVTTPWADVKRLRDEALVEGAVADKVAPGFAVGDVADLDFAGDARTAALDLSLADGRFAPDVLETAVRRAVAGWAEAIDGDDKALEAVATPAAVSALLHPGDPSGRTRLVVRGPKIRRVRIAALDAAAKPPAMTIDLEANGIRYVQDRDTTDVVSGSASGATDFTERWTMELQESDENPWRIAGVAGAAPA